MRTRSSRSGHRITGRTQTRPVTTRLVAGIVAAAALAAACSSPDSGAAGGSAEHRKPYRIVLSNNNLSASWRVQMVNGIKYVAAHKYANDVKFTVRQAGESVSDHIASLQQIIRARPRPDAILLDASSATALNPTVEQACKAGIVVFSFDQVVTAPCAYKLAPPVAEQARESARWMCEATGGHGKVVLDQAIPGVPSVALSNATWRSTLARTCPGLQIAGTYQSGFAPGPELQAVSAVLAGHRDLSGVLSLSYCSSVITAFRNAHLPPVPTTCVAANGNAIACESAHATCHLSALPPIIASSALRKVVDLLGGQKQPLTQQAVFPSYVSTAAKTGVPAAAPLPALRPGTDYFPGQSPDLVLPVTTEDLGVTPSVALTGAEGRG
ncbi:substrate-binding domain-containing protein [Actinomadura roseirufa]|uniref:substrate-binding domain-containing protein n=1 Tax=Actinomadura roseirufa TaxID=2094049 RepID=UPI0013F179D0|nr:substrate-binding domain-containing protein [Actinomadura roseirufa]